MTQSLKDYTFTLPEELIAQHPATERDASRLCVVGRNDDSVVDSHFDEIGRFLRDDDVLVVNDTRVMKARLYMRRATGARVEVVLAEKAGDAWFCVTNRTARLREGEVLTSEEDDTIHCTVGPRRDDYITLIPSEDLDPELLDRIGHVPLPPYIRRNDTENDAGRYQTVFARSHGAVAAPTAGLHFTDSLLQKLRDRGISILPITLHVSWGTFQPVREDDLDTHIMHKEEYSVPTETARFLNEARGEGRRIISVGTTSLRVLETVYVDGIYQAGRGSTDIFIRPPRTVLSVDGLLTNFHTPQSTLLMLVASFAGYEKIMRIYQRAVEKKYRFFSYGDAMLIV